MARWVLLLQKVMNIAARLILRKPRDYSTTEMFRELHWLKMEDRISFKVLSLTWKALNNSSPSSYISNLITPRIPTRHLRSSDNLDLLVPKTRTCFGDRAFRSSAPKLWNALPKIIRKQTSLSSFKSKLKLIYFEKRTVNHYKYGYCSA